MDFFHDEGFLNGYLGFLKVWLSISNAKETIFGNLIVKRERPSMSCEAVEKKTLGIFLSFSDGKQKLTYWKPLKPKNGWK